MSSGAGSGQFDCLAIGRGEIDLDPANVLVREACPQITAARGGRIGQRHRRRAIGEYRGAGIARAVSPRHHHRHGDDAGDQTAEERHHEFDAGRKHQDGAVAGTRGHGQSQSEGGCGVMQLAEGEDSFLRPAIGYEDVGPIVGLLRRTSGQQCHERAEGFHGLRRLLPPSGGGTDCALVGEKSRQRLNGRMVVEVVRRQFEVELLLEFHHQVDQHRRIEPKAAEFTRSFEIRRIFARAATQKSEICSRVMSCPKNNGTTIRVTPWLSIWPERRCVEGCGLLLPCVGRCPIRAQAGAVSCGRLRQAPVAAAAF